jgi:hypothetical protein
MYQTTRIEKRIIYLENLSNSNIKNKVKDVITSKINQIENFSILSNYTLLTVFTKYSYIKTYLKTEERIFINKIIKKAYEITKEKYKNKNMKTIIKYATSDKPSKTVTEASKKQLLEEFKELKYKQKREKEKNKKAVEDMKKIYVSKTDDIKYIYKKDLDKYISDGYVKGLSAASKIINKTMNIKRDDETKRIRAFKYQKYIEDGWI